jgi:ubiquinone biosynthesis protein
MVFGYFHADPHPGNLLILPGPVVCMLDLGMVGRLNRRTREEIVDLVLAVTRRDPKAMVTALLRMTEWEEEPDRRDFERDVADFVDQHLRGPLKDLVLGQVLQQIFELASQYRLRVPADLLFLIKALTVIEGLARQLNPDFDIVAKARPFVKKVQMERFSPGRLAGDLQDYTAEWLDIARDLPSDIRTIIRLVRTGKIKVQLEHGGLENLRHTLDQTNNRLSYALVLASLIIASSLIVQSGIPPTWHGIPIIGLVGYIVAGAMGLWLLITILRRGMM